VSARERVDYGHRGRRRAAALSIRRLGDPLWVDPTARNGEFWCCDNGAEAARFGGANVSSRSGALSGEGTRPEQGGLEKTMLRDAKGESEAVYKLNIETN
jgi:hypothetical protein